MNAVMPGLIFTARPGLFVCFAMVPPYVQQ
jgi:hypothetical protein